MKQAKVICVILATISIIIIILSFIGLRIAFQQESENVSESGNDILIGASAVSDSF